MNEIISFKIHLDEFCKEFFESDIKKNLKKCDDVLCESKELNILDVQKKEIENELSHLVDLPREKRGEREQDLLKAYQEIKKKIDSLPEVKSYLEAYGKVKEIKDLFNDKIYGVIA